MAASSRRFPPRSSLSARRVLRNLVAFALLYGAGLAAVWGFSLLGVSTLVAFPVFVLGVLITSLETDSGLWGAALGVAYLLSYDFLFTAPLFTLKVLSRTDVAALAIFLVVSLIMGVITHRMSRQVQAAERTACALGRLNRLSVGLLESSTPQAACSFAQEFLTRVLRRPVTITLGEPPAAGSAAARDCYERRAPTGYGEPGWRDATEKYLPLGMKGRLYGVVAIDCSSGDVDSGSLSLVNAVVAPDPRGRGAQRAGGRRARRRRRPSGHIGPVQRQERCRTDTSGSALIDRSRYPKANRDGRFSAPGALLVQHLAHFAAALVVQGLLVGRQALQKLQQLAHMLALLVTDVGEHLLRILVIRRLDVGVVLVDSLKLPDDVLANGVDELLVSQLARHFHHERIRNCGHDGSFLAASKRPVLATPAVARRQARGSVGHPRRLGWSRSPGRLVATDL